MRRRDMIKTVAVVAMGFAAGTKSVLGGDLLHPSAPAAAPSAALDYDKLLEEIMLFYVRQYEHCRVHNVARLPLGGRGQTSADFIAAGMPVPELSPLLTAINRNGGHAEIKALVDTYNTRQQGLVDTLHWAEVQEFTDLLDTNQPVFQVTSPRYHCSMADLDCYRLAAILSSVIVGMDTELLAQCQDCITACREFYGEGKSVVIILERKPTDVYTANNARRFSIFACVTASGILLTGNHLKPGVIPPETRGMSRYKL